MYGKKKNNNIDMKEIYDYKEVVGEGKAPLNSLSRKLKKQLNSEKKKLSKVYKWE